MSEPKWRRYLRFWGSDPKADADDELAFHLESRARDLEATGLTREQALAEARRRFGDVDRVRSHVEAIDRGAVADRRRRERWVGLGQDARIALRGLRRSPGFAIVAGLTLALGIGATSATFTVVNGVLLRPLPWREEARLVRLFTAFRAQNTDRFAMSQPEFMDYRGLTRVFERAAAFTGANLTLTGRAEPERLRGLRVTRDFLPTLGVAPSLGRNFDGDDGRTGTEPVVIVSHELWQRSFAGDRALLGRSLMLNGVSHRVVGILPKESAYNRSDALVPLFINPDSLTGRSSNYLHGVARLRDRVTLEDAQRALDALTRESNARYPQNYPTSMGYAATVVPLRDQIVGDAKPALLVLLGAVVLVLLIACANVTNLFLARGSARQRDVAVRLALGAGRLHVVRQQLVESTILAAVSGVVGTFVAWWGVKALLAIDPSAVPMAEEVRMDATVGIVTLVVSVVAGVSLGLPAAIALMRTGVNANLKEGGRGGSDGRERHRLGRALVAGEIALAVVVLVGATLLVRSFQSLRSTDPGFRPDGILVVDLTIPTARYDDAAASSFYQRLVERAALIPGVEVAAAASELPPFASGNNWDIGIDGRAIAAGETAPSPNVRAVTPGYFRALQIGTTRGRSLEVGDVPGAPLAAVINETSARLWWPNVDPVGQRVRFGRKLPWITIVGVVKDVRSMGLGQSPPAELFLPHAQMLAAAGESERTMYLTLRTRLSDPGVLATQARQLVRELDPLLAITAIRSMTELLDASVAQQRFTMLLLGVFGAVALTLASIGVYGLLSFSVRRRTREIGIRIALGGAPGDVLRMVIGQGVRLAAVGLAVGVVAALIATRFMSGMLYGVAPNDPPTYAFIVGVLVAVASLASWLPARRAVATDPRQALGAEV